MELPFIFTCTLFILGCDSRLTCVDRTEDLRLDCGVDVVYVEGAAALGDCSESVTCCQDTSYSDDMIMARVRHWCQDRALCRVSNSTWNRVKGMVVRYSCRPKATVQNISKCYGSFFNTPMCFGGTTIEITNATFGKSACQTAQPCCPAPNDCTALVARAKPDYYNNITAQCNYQTSCGNLQADWTSPCSTGVAGPTNYVTLYYMCLTETERRTSVPATTIDVTMPRLPTVSTIKPGATTPIIGGSMATSVAVSTLDVTTDSTVPDGPNAAAQTTVIIAVIVAVILAVVVPVTVCMVCRRRKANSASESDNTVGVDDVDPYHTARPGGGPGPQGPQPAQGLNDVTKPATNLSDTGQPLTKPMVAKKPKPNPKAVDKPNIGADLYTEVVKVRPRKNVVLDKSPGEEDVEANNNGSDMTEARDRASYDLVMQENHEYGTRQGVDIEGEGEGHGVDGEGLPHEGPQDSDQDEQTDPDYDLVMTENNVYN